MDKSSFREKKLQVWAEVQVPFCTVLLGKPLTQGMINFIANAGARKAMVLSLASTYNLDSIQDLLDALQGKVIPKSLVLSGLKVGLFLETRDFIQVIVAHYSEELELSGRKKQAQRVSTAIQMLNNGASMQSVLIGIQNCY